MKHIQIGDRVAVYSPRGRKTGTVQAFACDGFPMVQEDGPYGGYMAWHPKQCRRLIKRPRQRVWLKEDMRKYTMPLGPGWTEFVQVKRRPR